MNNFCPPKKCLVSACLIGLCTRYDGRSKPNIACKQQLASSFWIPVCPEQLGGLPTPRPAARLVGGGGQEVLVGKARVINSMEEDVTSQFIKGAQETLALARLHGASHAMLKARSPSCGLLPLQGVTAALLLQHHIKIIQF